MTRKHTGKDKFGFAFIWVPDLRRTNSPLKTWNYCPPTKMDYDDEGPPDLVGTGAELTEAEENRPKVPITIVTGSCAFKALDAKVRV